MPSIAEKLTYLHETKDKIKESIQNKGIDVPDDATFRSYANMIDNIHSLNIAFGYTPPKDTSRLWVKTDKPNRIRLCQKLEYQTYKDSAMQTYYKNYLYSIGWSHEAIVIINKKAYVFGYENIQTYGNSILIYEYGSYEPISSGASTPFKMRYIGGRAVAGAKIFLFGAWNDRADKWVDSIWEFNTETLTFSEVATIPNPIGDRCEISAVAVGDMIYFVHCGKIYTLDTNSYEITDLNIVVFDDGITQACQSIIAIGTKIYLFGSRCVVTDKAVMDLLKEQGADASWTSSSVGWFYAYCGGHLDNVYIFDTKENILIDTEYQVHIPWKYETPVVYIENKFYILYSSSILEFDPKSQTTFDLGRCRGYTESSNPCYATSAEADGTAIYYVGSALGYSNNSHIRVFDVVVGSADLTFEARHPGSLLSLNEDFSKVSLLNISSAYITTGYGDIEHVPVAQYVNGEWIEIGDD